MARKVGKIIATRRPYCAILSRQTGCWASVRRIGKRLLVPLYGLSTLSGGKGRGSPSHSGKGALSFRRPFIGRVTR